MKKFILLLNLFLVFAGTLMAQSAQQQLIIKGDGTKYYDGKPFGPATNDGYTIISENGLAQGDSAVVVITNTEAVCPGEYPNDIVSVTIYRTGETVTDVTENYAITTQPGTLIIRDLACEGIDYNGQFYEAVKIGEQCWMKENLRFDTLENSVYKNEEANLEKFGRLYTWYAAMGIQDETELANIEKMQDVCNGNFVKGICPQGWAIPTNADFEVLSQNVAGMQSIKSDNSNYWIPSEIGDNSTGFDARGAGLLNAATARFENLLSGTYYWTCDGVFNVGAYPAGIGSSMAVTYYCDNFIPTPSNAKDMKSIRCIRKAAYTDEQEDCMGFVGAPVITPIYKYIDNEQILDSIKVSVGIKNVTTENANSFYFEFYAEDETRIGAAEAEINGRVMTGALQVTADNYEDLVGKNVTVYGRLDFVDVDYEDLCEPRILGDPGVLLSETTIMYLDGPVVEPECPGFDGQVTVLPTNNNDGVPQSLTLSIPVKNIDLDPNDPDYLAYLASFQFQFEIRYVIDNEINYKGAAAEISNGIMTATVDLTNNNYAVLIGKDLTIAGRMNLSSEEDQSCYDDLDDGVVLYSDPTEYTITICPVFGTTTVTPGQTAMQVTVTTPVSNLQYVDFDDYGYVVNVVVNDQQLPAPMNVTGKLNKNADGMGQLTTGPLTYTVNVSTLLDVYNIDANTLNNFINNGSLTATFTPFLSVPESGCGSNDTVYGPSKTYTPAPACPSFGESHVSTTLENVTYILYYSLNGANAFTKDNVTIVLHPSDDPTDDITEQLELVSNVDGVMKLSAPTHDGVNYQTATYTLTVTIPGCTTYTETRDYTESCPTLGTTTVGYKHTNTTDSLFLETPISYYGDLNFIGGSYTVYVRDHTTNPVSKKMVFQAYTSNSPQGVKVTVTNEKLSATIDVVYLLQHSGNKHDLYSLISAAINSGDTVYFEPSVSLPSVACLDVTGAQSAYTACPVFDKTTVEAGTTAMTYTVTTKMAGWNWNFPNGTNYGYDVQISTLPGYEFRYDKNTYYQYVTLEGVQLTAQVDLASFATNYPTIAQAIEEALSNNPKITITPFIAIPNSSCGGMQGEVTGEPAIYPEPATGHALSQAVKGDIICSDGLAYAGTAYNNLPDGVTAVALVCYVTSTPNGNLAFALADEGSMSNGDALSACSIKTTVPGGSWTLPDQGDWNDMIEAAGSSEALRTGFLSVGGANMELTTYWSSSDAFNTPDEALYWNFSNAQWGQGSRYDSHHFRACLRF